jgi:divalent metal cation (Fe/Co/Zn/Cd) transporter
VIIGVCFMALALYVAIDAISALVRRETAAASPVGIVIAALSVVIMPVLAHRKRRVAMQLASGALEAETRQTAVCACLSAILLAGLGVNAWLGWWWADPVAGLVMVPLIAREGLEALRGETCCPH